MNRYEKNHRRTNYYQNNGYDEQWEVERDSYDNRNIVGTGFFWNKFDDLKGLRGIFEYSYFKHHHNFCVLAQS